MVFNATFNNIVVESDIKHHNPNPTTIYCC